MRVGRKKVKLEEFLEHGHLRVGHFVDMSHMVRSEFEVHDEEKFVLAHHLTPKWDVGSWVSVVAVHQVFGAFAHENVHPQKIHVRLANFDLKDSCKALEFRPK